MSDSDSFINEVSEDLRRDRLFGAIRRYGWIAVVAVVLLVGAAAWTEYRKASARAEAEAFGDAVLTALDASDADARRAALDDINAEGTRAALLAMLKADTLDDAASRDALAADLQAIADDDGVADLYRDMASLKLAMLGHGTVPPEELRARLDPLTAPGAPFRLLAVEQQALTRLAEGATDQAIADLRMILDADQATQGLRQRARQLIVALGGTLDGAS